MTFNSAPVDVIVLGAGISGLTAAYDVNAKGAITQVIDSFPEPGGNHISLAVAGYSFDIGSFFFAPDNPQFKMFPDAVRDCVPMNLTIERLRPDGQISLYPFSPTELKRMSLYSLVRLGASLLIGKITSRNYENADQYMNYYLGRFYKNESGLYNYVRRFYNKDPATIHGSFAVARMGWIKENGGLRRVAAKTVQSLATAVKRTKAPPDAAAPWLARPKEGFSHYYGPIVSHLESKGVTFQLGAGIRSVRRENGLHRVDTDAGVFWSRRIISTVPLPVALKFIGLEACKALESSRMITLCCSFLGTTNISAVVLYNFDNVGIWKRLTMHSRYYGAVDGREYMSVECVVPPGGATAEDMFKDFAAHVRDRKFIDGDLKLEAALELDFAYPVYTLEAESAKNDALQKLEAAGIESVGRQGRHEYIPHSTLVIEAVRRRLAISKT